MRWHPGIAVPVHTTPHQNNWVFPIPSTAFIYNTSSGQTNLLQVKYGNISWSILIPCEFKQFLLMICYVPRTTLTSECSMVTMLQCSPLRTLHSNGEVRQLNRMVSARPGWWWPREFPHLWSWTTQEAPSCPGCLRWSPNMPKQPKKFKPTSSSPRGNPCKGWSYGFWLLMNCF